VSREWEKVALEWLDRLNIGSDDSPQRWGEVVRLAALLAETHAAGKREGIEAAAQWLTDEDRSPGVADDMRSALLQTEA
jgi:hypothetical protein